MTTSSFKTVRKTKKNMHVKQNKICVTGVIKNVDRSLGTTLTCEIKEKKKRTRKKNETKQSSRGNVSRENNINVGFRNTA